MLRRRLILIAHADWFSDMIGQNYYVHLSESVFSQAKWVK